MKNTLLNHDCFNTWQTCPQKYCYKYIKEIKIPEFHNDYELGRAIHALIDYHLRGFGTEHLLKNADDKIVSRWNAIKNHPIMNKKLIETEWGFNTNIKKTVYWLTGRIDAVFFDKDTGKYIIADWKTGKVIPKKINSYFQHKIYLYALYQCRKDLKIDFKPDELSFQYFEIIPESVNITEIKFSEEKLIEYEKNFFNIIKKIENAKNITVPEICPDRYCKYKKLCKNNLNLIQINGKYKR